MKTVISKLKTLFTGSEYPVTSPELEAATKELNDSGFYLVQDKNDNQVFHLHTLVTGTRWMKVNGKFNDQLEATTRALKQVNTAKNAWMNGWYIE